MRYLLLIWFVPLFLFWGWYGLSAYDINFGTIFFSRELHDVVFAIYAQTLGIDAESLPPMLASASIVDSLIVGAIAAYRWRASWWPGVRERIGSAWSRLNHEKREPAENTQTHSPPYTKEPVTTP